MAAREEGIEITNEEAQKIIDVVFAMYPGLVSFFEECRSRAVAQGEDPAPQWLCGPFGRFRRFQLANDRKAKGDIEREAQNFPIQGMIADAVSRAVDHLYNYRKECDAEYFLAMQIHDAVMLQVPYRWVGAVIDDVLPTCMRDRVPIYPCTLDGMSNGTGPYNLGIDTDICHHWGIHMTPDECEQVGVDCKYAGWRPAKDGIGLACTAFSKKRWIDNKLVKEVDLGIGV